MPATAEFWLDRCNRDPSVQRKNAAVVGEQQGCMPLTEQNEKGD